jgi:hypothetical protein
MVATAESFDCSPINERLCEKESIGPMWGYALRLFRENGAALRENGGWATSPETHTRGVAGTPRRVSLAVPGAGVFFGELPGTPDDERRIVVFPRMRPLPAAANPTTPSWRTIGIEHDWHGKSSATNLLDYAWLCRQSAP